MKLSPNQHLRLTLGLQNYHRLRMNSPVGLRIAHVHLQEDLGRTATIQGAQAIPINIPQRREIHKHMLQAALKNGGDQETTCTITKKRGSSLYLMAT